MKQVIDALTLGRMVTRMSHEIIEKNGVLEGAVLVGIKTRGVYLAHRVAERLAALHQQMIDVESLDISNYRDDKAHTGEPTGITQDLTGKQVILVDDVLSTGRTIRAALDALLAHGRPRQIQLLVLVDRGHREFPIRPDFVGKNLPTAKREQVHVALLEVDGQDQVCIVASDSPDTLVMNKHD
jgi:pyrimidine operon attenuation protein/uracil phosphoribosyltransferase